MISKTLTTKTNFDFLLGEVLLIDKEIGKTSFNVVHNLRKITGVKKIGHAGTLDPAATGLLIVCTGKKTKEIRIYQDQTKTYSGIITLGIKTPSMDSETEAIEICDASQITPEEMEETRKKFVGEIEQIPPMYSALKFKGQALYKYARKGIDVKREPRKVNILSFEITKTDLPDIHFSIECSKGTYIRVIADDFGSALGCGAYLKSLRRIKIGEYAVDNAFTLKELEDYLKSSNSTGGESIEKN
ncbi:MAG: tRNA pseudouridine(55) synthase TruB [Bacteroidetes bacterium]|nr:tRNA pseudouridine(55) synthase TruB [Bacteroidota bacterium]MBU1680777.1 tRNA pseudouridine(55) synthase TruB [Bacteroidota bacterium]MBU2505690.1 tRNA pseudouridine(55) synthase TruB [Bacteroidota bacterium]